MGLHYLQKKSSHFNEKLYVIFYVKNNALETREHIFKSLEKELFSTSLKLTIMFISKTIKMLAYTSKIIRII